MTIDMHFPDFDVLTPDWCRSRALEAIDTHRHALMVLSEAPATVDDFLVPFDLAYEEFSRGTKPLQILAGAVGGEAWDDAYKHVSGPLTKHLSWVRTNEALYAQFCALEAVELDSESRFLVETQLTEFRLGGIGLEASARRQLEEIDLQLSDLTTEYAQRVAKMLSSTVTIADQTYPLNNFTNQLALVDIDDASQRSQLLAISMERGFGADPTTDTRALVQQIANARITRAHLLGFPTHAHTVIEQETAPGVDAVRNLLATVAKRAFDRLESDASELRALAVADGREDLTASDWLYYEAQLKEATLGISNDKLSPYLELWRVVEDGVFFAAHQLFGITLRRRSDLRAWDASCRVYEVRDEDDGLLGLFIADYFTRDGKNGGAWMTEFVASSEHTGHQSIIINCANFEPPANGEHKYLVWDEVITVFHEFGHALHGLLSKTRYSLTSGTSVPRDFVELPSQLNEMWAYHPAVIDRYMRNDAGEVVEPKLVEQIIRLKHFGQAHATIEYCAAALLDQAWHGIEEATDEAVVEFESAALKAAGVAADLVPPRYRSTYFPHIFTVGYDGGYYSYMWSEALVGECEQWFKNQDPNTGGFNREAGHRYAAEILSRGYGRDPRESFLALVGHDARPDAIFQRRGL